MFFCNCFQISIKLLWNDKIHAFVQQFHFITLPVCKYKLWLRKLLLFLQIETQFSSLVSLKSIMLQSKPKSWSPAWTFLFFFRCQIHRYVTGLSMNPSYHIAFMYWLWSTSIHLACWAKHQHMLLIWFELHIFSILNHLEI